jgi:hypothetical protein
MPVSEHEVTQAIERIASDLAATLGWDRPQAIAFAEQAGSVSANWWDADPGEYAIKVAEEVQQRLHDTFVDTTWPACPARLGRPRPPPAARGRAPAALAHLAPTRPHWRPRP